MFAGAGQIYIMGGTVVQVVVNVHPGELNVYFSLFKLNFPSFSFTLMAFALSVPAVNSLR